MQDVIKKFHKSLSKEEYLTSYNMARNCDLVFAEALTHEQFENLNLNKSEYTVYENNSDYLIYRKNYLTISEGDIIFCKGDFIFELFSILNKLKDVDNISILTHQMAKPGIGKELFELKPSCVKFWYALNVDYEDPFLVPVPLGLGNEYANANLQIEEIRNTFNTSDEIYNRNTILVNFDTSTSPKRKEVKLYYKNFSWATNEEIESKQSFINYLNQNKYVACPEGWGLDTHRYWESLYFGVIPVVNNSYDYNKLHTPAQYEYAEIEEISKEALELEYKILINKLLNNLEKLTISWWFENVIIKEDNLYNHKEKIEYKFRNKLSKRYLKLRFKINKKLLTMKIKIEKK
jgi:hypothetical protein